MDNKPWQPDYPPILNFKADSNLVHDFKVAFGLVDLQPAIRYQNLRAHNETVKIIMEIIK